MRSDTRDKNTEWSEENTKKLLSELSFEYKILYNIKSPRIMYDDSRIEAIRKK